MPCQVGTTVGLSSQVGARPPPGWRAHWFVVRWRGAAVMEEAPSNVDMAPTTILRT
jgi:hypothetical protein